MFLVISFEVAAIDVIALAYCELPPTGTTSADQLKPKNSIDKVISISWLLNKLKGGKFTWPSTFSPRPKRMKTILVPYTFGALGIACWPLVPKFAASNPAEAVGFLGRKKSSERLPSERK